MALNEQEIEKIKQCVKEITKNINRINTELNEANSQLQGVTSYLSSENAIGLVKAKSSLEYFRSTSKLLVDSFEMAKQVKTLIEGRDSNECKEG